jgi:hypothetical protein
VAIDGFSLYSPHPASPAGEGLALPVAELPKTRIATARSISLANI